ncbi:MAG: TIGR04283 family arsenosugar biosynthesis glycosyltransferase [Coleofasciculus sp. G1-WW12-02]|uniref:TIGR04283 family arsenosugar biosynthesis glycosyltransferase n=1 Tax=Coleofasciculus sp. G1-WW12-02 TaxID=3068483 RepID=UPI0032F471E0
MQTETISVIIPVLNEASTIGSVLERLMGTNNVDVIVVDGGSRDETVTVARSRNVQVISTPPGRACQMNAGAARATGDILLFLHADTRLPANFDCLVRQALQEPQTIAGAFELRIDSQQLGLRLIERLVNWRSRFFSMPYGDQAIFLKATIFHSIGGFPNLPIMEDFEFIRRLKHQGRISIVPASILTSGRRWERLGIIKTTLINQLIILGYFFGVSPDKLARWYRGKG